MKFPLLGLLVLFAYAVCAQTGSLKLQTRVKQCDKKLTFDISIAPNAFSDVEGRSNTSSYIPMDFGINHYVYSSNLHQQQYGGIDLAAGVAIKKKFHFNLLTGIFGNNNVLWIPAGADFKVNFLKGKCSPFFHVGSGYIYEASNKNNDLDILITSSNGTFAQAGIGISVRLTKVSSLTLSPEYRFIYNNYKYDYEGIIFDGFGSGSGGTGTVKQVYNQLGLKLAFVFY